jgi:hypothetical protein
MAYITLNVTTRVIQQVAATNSGQRQIAIQTASPQLLRTIGASSANHRVVIAVNGVFELTFGGPGAIWGNHQLAGLQAEDFTSLYDLLARRPDRPVRFAWDE